MESVDEFKPSTTEPVFGSGLIQTKVAQQDPNVNDKVNAVPEPIANGQNEVEASPTPSNGHADSSTSHVNGQTEKALADIPQVEDKPTEEPPAASSEPEPVVSASTNEISSPATTDDTASQPIETTTTSGRKGRPSRVQAKPQLVSANATRQSARSKKVTSTSTEDSQPVEKLDRPAATTTNQNEPPKRTKRQAAAIAKDAITASHQPISTSDSSNADDGNDQDAIPSDVDDDDEISESKRKKSASPARKGVAAKKRGASLAMRNTSKKSKAKASITSTDDGDSESEHEQTPPKKARTTANNKTPEVTEEYVRKLRPRK